MSEIRLIKSLKGHIGIIWSVLWSFSGNFLVSIGVDASLNIWGPSEKTIPGKYYKKSLIEILYFKSWRRLYVIKISKFLRTFRGLSKKINSNFFSISDFHGYSYLLEITFLKCYKICILEIKHIIKGHLSEIKDCCFSVKQNFFASCGRDKSVWIWKNNFKRKIECDHIFKENNGDIKCLTWNPIFEEIVSSTYEGFLGLFKYQADNGSLNFKISNSTIWIMSFDRLGKELIIGNGIGELTYLNFHLKDDRGLTVKTNLEKETILIFFFSCYTIHSLNMSNKNFLHSIGNSIGLMNLAKNQKFMKKMKMKKNWSFERENCFFLNINAHLSSFHFGKINKIIWHPIFGNIFLSCGDDASLNIWKIE